MMLSKAKRKSNDLLWICRSDRGMRPRTAMSLWNALVRPILEYASELWAAQTTATFISEAETLQMKFIRGILGQCTGGAPNAALRAEVGAERLPDRWDKLLLGYWRRVMTAPQTRLLSVIARFRKHEHMHAASHQPVVVRGTAGSLGWLPTVEATLTKYNLRTFWRNSDILASISRDNWQDKVYQAVETSRSSKCTTEMTTRPHLKQYSNIKSWSRNPPKYSAFTGEIDKFGYLVPERYLDKKRDKGTRLKLLFRMDSAPIMDRVGREHGWPKEERICEACHLHQVETTTHFILECPLYARHRTKLLKGVHKALARSRGTITSSTFRSMTPIDQTAILLGQRIDDIITENRIDSDIKFFLRKAWNEREPITDRINQVFRKQYSIM
jgi:hypothetical protein